jgi:hypothetical protein
MAEPRRYKTAEALRTALETRLQDMARSRGADIQRLRRRVAFDRLLARLFTAEPLERFPWFLKGGYAMELRMRQARTTKDIDLTITASGQAGGVVEEAERVRGLLQQASSVNLPDGFIFFIGESVLELNAPPEGGSRYPARATMAGRTFARFHVDVGIGDDTLDPVDRIEGDGWFDFAGLPRPEFRMISREQQFSEKIHAYTLPRVERENSRVKDLVDLLLLLQAGMEADRVRRNLRKTFERRHTHPIPVELPPPPPSWETRFEILATECGLDTEMERAFQTLAVYFRNVL